ncbi:MAG TPA: Nramp family divalent metal transporter [Candidatus Binataceae bacterium]|nr:Nramp family divalent metal transporter [Candidatus Binataceae bacterium]
MAVPRVSTPGTKHARALARFGSYVGPAFLVAVGYIDPGNWATDLEAGSRFGYQLLWVIFVSNLIALIVQSMSARLGLVTGESYAANCRRHFSGNVWVTFWIIAEAGLIATDVAEFMGAMLGFQLLFGIGTLLATCLSVLSAFGILALYRYGDQTVERLFIFMIMLVGLCYLVELKMAPPDWAAVLTSTFWPRLDHSSAAIAAGIVGATVMPHNLFLHSSLVRRNPDEEKRFALRSTAGDSLIALNASWLINAAILITAATVFFKHGRTVVSIEQAHLTLLPLLGSLAAGAFALGLLVAGISSSAAATLAGQVVFEGFWGKGMNLFLRRALTLIPALIILAMGFDPFRILILSQITLSLVLPFALIPLVFLTARPAVMGKYANGWLSNILALLATAAVLWFNGMLLWSVT